MLENFSAGGAAINQICAAFDIGLKVFDLALDIPTGDITAGPAHGGGGLRRDHGLRHGGDRRRHRPARARRNGHRQHHHRRGHLSRALWRHGGRLGRAAAPASTMPAWRARSPRWRRRVALHRGHLGDPLEVLRRLGGREIAAIAGAILAARTQGVPVMLDGYVVCAAAAVLHALDPATLDHCIAGHVSAEGAHREVLRRLGKRPLLDLGMRLGEGIRRARWRSASSRPPSPATAAWPPSARPASPTRNDVRCSSWTVAVARGPIRPATKEPMIATANAGLERSSCSARNEPAFGHAIGPGLRLGHDGPGGVRGDDLRCAHYGRGFVYSESTGFCIRLSRLGREQVFSQRQGAVSGSRGRLDRQWLRRRGERLDRRAQGHRSRPPANLRRAQGSPRQQLPNELVGVRLRQRGRDRPGRSAPAPP